MKQDTKHQIGIVVKYHGPTYNRGARISLTLPRWQSKRIYIPFGYEYHDTLDNAMSALDAAGVRVSAHLDMDSHYVLCCNWSEQWAIFNAFGLKEI